MKRNYFEVCQKCGAHLDPGEKCDCEVSPEDYETCEHCGRIVEKHSLCNCTNRREFFKKVIEEGKKYNIPHKLQPSTDVTFDAIKGYKTYYDVAVLFYSAGVAAERVFQEGKR